MLASSIRKGTLPNATGLSEQAKSNDHHSTSSSGLTSPSAFINRHANRFKQITQNILPSSNNLTSANNNSNNNPNNTSQNISSSPTLKSHSTQWNGAKNNLIILANAAAIELYFLCVEDEMDADKLCTRCSEKFFINLSLSETILQAPLIASCIQVLGRLALKYPMSSKTSVKHLTDFLTEHRPIINTNNKKQFYKNECKSL